MAQKLTLDLYLPLLVEKTVVKKKLAAGSLGLVKLECNMIVQLVFLTKQCFKNNRSLVLTVRKFRIKHGRNII